MKRLRQDDLWGALESRGAITLLGAPGCSPCEAAISVLGGRLSDFEVRGWSVNYIYVGYSLGKALRDSGLLDAYPTVVIRWPDGRLELHHSAFSLESAVPSLLEAWPLGAVADVLTESLAAPA